MTFARILASGATVLAEASVYERLRRDPRIRFDPSIAHGSVLYDQHGQEVLALIHAEYLEVGWRSGLPMLVQTDTWRCSGARIAASGFKGRDVNADNVAFLREVVAEWRSRHGDEAPPVYVAGLMGPQGDAFRPAEALEEREAENYHREQVEALAAAGVDLVVVATLCARTEALGIARALSGQPHLLSFVIRSSGALLDGTPLVRMIEEIENAGSGGPMAYGINCAHPSTVRAALRAASDGEREVLRQRVVFLQANASALSPEELDDQPTVVGDDPSTFAAEMGRLRSELPLRVIGGCCGTDARHLVALTAR